MFRKAVILSMLTIGGLLCGLSMRVEACNSSQVVFVTPSNQQLLTTSTTPLIINNVVGGQRVVTGGGANVNIVEQRRGLLGLRHTSVIQASAGNGASVNVVKGR